MGAAGSPSPPPRPTRAAAKELGRTAAEFLVLHAAALMGVTAAARKTSPRRARGLLLAGAALAVGTLLFAADLTKLAFTASRLFPYAAPTGGSLMILSWIALAVVFAVAEKETVGDQRLAGGRSGGEPPDDTTLTEPPRRAGRDRDLRARFRRRP